MESTATVAPGNALGASATHVFRVSIHPCADTSGYWAECPMENGCCFTDGETIQETQKNMFESVSLYLEDYPEISNYRLTFEVCDAKSGA